MVDPEPASYPTHWEADVLLKDGSTARIRPIRTDDGPRIVDLHSQLSEQSIYFRFFAPYPVLAARDVERFTHVDYDDRVALVATVAGAIVGVVRYDRLAPGGDEAEVAFTVRDDYQGLGVGSMLLEHLTGVARERDIRRFIAEVLPANHRMLGVFRDAGYASAMAMEDGVVRLDLAIEPTFSSRAITESREHRAEARSIERLLAPRAVAVVGASRDPRSVGSTLLRNLVESGFTGEVSAVNPHAEEPVLGVPTYASVSEIPGTVDLAIVASPAETLLDVVADCATKGVHGLVVVSGGFAETGTEGRERQRRLVRAAHGAGMRVVGPNCLGLINTDPAHLLNASLSPIMPTRGRIGFFSQSGALGIALLETLVRRGLGVSSFVSAGNRADVSGNDLIQFWEEDEDTDVLLLYIESIGNPRKFSRIARRTSRTKPIVAVKSGRSSQGIPLGHRVRSTTLPPSAVDEMFRQSGVIQVDTLGELFDVAMVLTYQPLPAGRRVAVVGNSDALAVLAADASASQGLQLTDAEHVLRPDTTAEDFGRELAAVVDDAGVDSVVVLFVPPISDSGEDFAAQISAVSRRATKPMVAIVLAVEGMSELLRHVNPDGLPILGSVPTFASVEDGVRALAAVTDYAEWRRRPDGVVPELLDLDRVACPGRGRPGDGDAAPRAGRWRDPISPSCCAATASTSGPRCPCARSRRRSRPAPGSATRSSSKRPTRRCCTARTSAGSASTWSTRRRWLEPSRRWWSRSAPRSRARWWCSGWPGTGSRAWLRPARTRCSAPWSPSGSGVSSPSWSRIAATASLRSPTSTPTTSSGHRAPPRCCSATGGRLRSTPRSSRTSSSASPGSPTTFPSSSSSS